MSDFHQFGPVTALPLLAARDVEEMERRLQALAARFPVSLVIPLVPSEMERPALGGILDELCRVRYLDSLVLSLNHASFDEYHRALGYFERYPGRKVVLWNEAPAVEGFVEEMGAAGLNTGDPGKGRACWLAIGHVLAEERAAYVAFQDADVTNFQRQMLARLVLPAVEPTVDFDFVKAYYARVSDRLHGRVTRLLLTPLLAAFTRLIGQDPYIRYLSSFRYALSGEFAIKSDLAERMRLPCDWGLEIVTLFEALRHRDAGRICQVEIADRYDHKHQALSGRRPLARPQPDGPRRGEAPAADPGRGRGQARPRPPDEPAGRLPARGRGRGRRQLRGGEHQRARLRPALGGAQRPGLHAGPALGDRRVPGRPPRPFSRPQLGPRLGRCPRRRREAAGRGGEGRRVGAAGVAMRRIGLVATDLDGTLLDRETYDFAPARPALEALRERGVPLVLVSSKTRAEMEPLADAIGATGPLVAENGGALVMPGGAVLALGVRRDRLLAELPAVTAEAGVRARPFASMSVAEVAALTGLSAEQAALAMRREYDEPFVVEDPRGHDPGVGARLDRAARARGLRVTHGGRVHHLTGPVDKGQALRAIIHAWPGGVAGDVVGLGDAANDLALLLAVDRPVVVPRPDGSVDPALATRLPAAERAPGPGPAGWASAVLAVLAGEPLSRVGA